MKPTSKPRRVLVRALQILVGLVLVLLLAGLVIRLLYPLPALAPRTVSQHLRDTGDTPLGRGVARLAAEHDTHSGLHTLNDARDAFAARILLARAATRSNGMDRVLAALDQHPNVEIRIFNPFVLRNPKMLGYLADFPRLNRRMHNKSFTADNQATIIGGRNIGDEYFDARDHGLFLDLDVLAMGPIVEDISADFDR